MSREVPPRLATWLLSRLLPERDRDAVLGDLVEEYELRLRSASPATVSRWYWGQVSHLTRQADLVAAKSFHGLTLRELNLPPARYMTVDFIKGAKTDANQYLWLWHFVPQQDRVRPMLRAGELQSVTSLPPTFKVYACEDSPNNFCPRMGRHHRDPAAPAGRRPTTTGGSSVLYGEAAGKLIFIEYIFSSEDLAAGASWPAIPLDGVPIPPIDNVHILHFNGAEGTAGRYTVHMYFIPEETYLAWEKEPIGL